MREWWSWQGRLAEGGSKMMTPFDVKILRFSKRALQVFGRIVGTPGGGPGHHISFQIPRTTTNHCFSTTIRWSNNG